MNENRPASWSRRSIVQKAWERRQLAPTHRTRARAPSESESPADVLGPRFNGIWIRRQR